jgi:hypothetical protein
MISQAELMVLFESTGHQRGIRAVAVNDDALRSEVVSGGVAIVDTNDLTPTEGYALLDLGEGAKVWRVQKVSGGWMAGNDDLDRCFLTCAQAADAWLGRVTHVFNPA